MGTLEFFSPALSLQRRRRPREVQEAEGRTLWPSRTGPQIRLFCRFFRSLRLVMFDSPFSPRTSPYEHPVGSSHQCLGVLSHPHPPILRSLSPALLPEPCTRLPLPTLSLSVFHLAVVMILYNRLGLPPLCSEPPVASHPPQSRIPSPLWASKAQPGPAPVGLPESSPSSSPAPGSWSLRSFSLCLEGCSHDTSLPFHSFHKQ